MSDELGRVLLVGAGPGAGDLVTLRGRRALQQAEVIVCDDLVPRSFLNEAGVSIAGKLVIWLERDDLAGRAQAMQVLARAAARGKSAARLKNGDPFVFGRADEEIQFLEERGIGWEAIPGLSACTAAPALAGMQLTLRGKARSFAAVTARRAPHGGVNDSFPRADTLLILMGVSVLGEVVERLRTQGWPADAPAALLERAAQPWERHARGKLGDIALIARSAGIESPALLVVGAAAEEDRPPHRGRPGRRRPTILFTGLDPTHFRSLGTLLHWPALETACDERGREALPSALRRLRAAGFDWALFTSKVGVQSFMEAAAHAGLDARLLAGTRIAACGPGTAARLAEFGLRADVVAAEPGSEGILQALGDVAGASLLLVQGTHAPAALEAALRDKGADVVRLALHRVVPNRNLGRRLPDHDVVYFASPSGARAFHRVYGLEAFRREVWCIGETTLAEVKHLAPEAEAGVVSPFTVREPAKAL